MGDGGEGEIIADSTVAPVCHGYKATIWWYMPKRMIPAGASIRPVVGPGGTGEASGEASGYVIYGTTGADVVVGSSKRDSIFTGGGNDVVCGDPPMHEEDELDPSRDEGCSGGGSPGHGGGGPDKIFGGSGNDRLYGGGGPDSIYGGSGDDIVLGGGGPDYIRGDVGSDSLFGGPGPDKIYGDDGNDMISGGASPDTLYGGNGNDSIRGDAGNDQMSGDNGYDYLYGGTGEDGVMGGRGNSVVDLGSQVPEADEGSCGGGSGGSRDSLIAKITREFPLSLHGTAKGMRFWYEASSGFRTQTGVQYDRLTCVGCHAYNSALTGVPSNQPCLACHTEVVGQPGVPNYDAVDQNKCMKCHSRQAAEIAMNLPDVHRAAGMKCSECHTSGEMHRGITATTMFDAMEARCENCHMNGEASTSTQIPGTPSHRRHGNRLDCQSCHMSGSVTCVNCHFEDDVTKATRTAYKRFADWLFLGNWNGEIRPLNVQTVEYQGKTFNAWGPFGGHTITAVGRSCADCHGNPNMLATSLQVTKWNPTTKTMDHLSGVIPVPWDYATRLKFDFVAKNLDGTWSYLKSGADRSQMLYATPLTPDQMQQLMTRR